MGKINYMPIGSCQNGSREGFRSFMHNLNLISNVLKKEYSLIR